MIDLVFVLTNKLEVSVKDLRKTVHDNQQENIARMEELNMIQKEKWTEFEEKIQMLKKDSEDSKEYFLDLRSENTTQRALISSLLGRFIYCMFVYCNF